MAVYYFNGDPIATPFTITSNEPTFDADTLSMSKRRASQGAQRWEMSFNIITKDNAAEQFMSSISKSTGTGFNSVGTMKMPQIVTESPGIPNAGQNIRFDATSTISAYATSVTIASGSTSMASGFLRRGYFFQFYGYPKIYVVTSDVDFSQNNPTLNFYPRLRQAITLSGSTGDILWDRNGVFPPMFSYWRDISNTRGITFTDGVLSSPGTINLIEAV